MEVFDRMLFTRESLEVDASSSSLCDSLNESEPESKHSIQLGCVNSNSEKINDGFM